MRLIQHILNVLCLVLIACSSWTQTESEIRKNADKLFEEEAYVQATPLYLQLLNLYPTDPDLNFRYGTCSLFNDDKQKTDAIKFLNAATQTATVDPRAFYFKGKALHLNYQFDEAKKFYKIYQSKRAAKDDRYDVDREIEMCQNGKKLMIQFTDIIVSEKTQIEDDKFFRLYKDVQSIGGDILVTERFQSKIDKKNGHIPIVHYPKNAKAVYYSSYGETGKTGLDIYVRKKLPDNSWGEPFRLPGEINTDYDEDFPYLHPNGRYLYFSSKGHNSMGGFDIFLARFNPETNEFQGIENVDFAISSPDDDLFYIVDSAYQNAYFASSRQSEEGKLHVYRVKVIRIPIQEIIVMGDYLSEINPDNKEMTIEVTSATTGSEIGKIVSNKVGKYSFIFPKGGKYNLKIKIDGLEPVTASVDLPFLDEFRPLKQKIVHYLDNGIEKIKIIDLFDESVEGGEELIAQVLREKSNLEVNIDNFDVDELRKIELEAQRNEILANLGFQGMSVREVQNQLSELTEADTDKTQQVEKLNAGISTAYIALSDEIEAITSERDEIIAKAGKETDPTKQYVALLEAQQLDVERSKLISQAEGLEDLGKEVKRKFGDDQPSTSEIAAVEAEFNRLIQAGKEDEALTYLAGQNDVIQESKRESTEGMVDKLVEEAIEKRAKQEELAQRNKDNTREIERAKTRKIELESKLPNAKKKEAEQINAELAELDKTIELYQGEKKYTQEKIIEVEKEIAVIDAQVDVIQSSGNSVLNEIDRRKFEEAQAAIRAQLANDRAEELAKQLALIEKNNPQFISVGPTFNTVSETDKLIEKHTVAIQQIAQNNDDRQAQIEAELTQNEQTINVVDQQLRAVQNQLEENPNDQKLLADQEKLNDFKEKLEDKQTSLATELKGLEPITDPVLTSENVVATLVPNHSANQQEIESNLSLTEIERLRQLQENDLILRNSAQERLTAIQNKLENDPSNSKLLQELQVVNDLLYDTNKLISERAERIEQIENQVPDVAITKEDLIADLAPNYQNQVKTIQSNPELSPVEKLEALNELDRTLENATQLRINQLDDLLEASPENPELKGEKQVLANLLTDLKSGIDKRETQIAALDSTEIQPFNSTEIIAKINPTYTSEITAIDDNEALPLTEKLSQKQELDRDLLEGLKEQLETIQTQLENDPSNQQLIVQEKGLEETIQATQNRIDDNADAIANLTNSTATVDVETTKQVILDEVKADYQERLTEINASNKSVVQRTLDRLELEQEILSSLIKRQATAESQSETNPADEQAKTQLNAVQQLIDMQKRAIEEQRSASLAAAISDKVYTETIATVDRKYSVEIGDLMQESNPSSEKIATRERALQEKLQAALEKKQKDLERKYSVNVDLETMILANEIKESKQRQLDAENGSTLVSTPENSEKEFVKSLRVEFNSSEELVFTKSNPTLEEAQNHEVKLIEYQEALTERESEIETQLEETPNDQSLKNQLSWIQNEQRAVETELRRMKVTIGELETGTIATRTSVQDDPEIKELQTKRVDLENQLNDPNLSSSERKLLEEELAEVNTSTLKRTNDLQSELLVEAQTKQDNLNNALQKLGVDDPQTTEVKSALAASEEERKAIDNLLVESDKAKSEEERNYLLNEANTRQEQLNSRLERVVENREIQNIEEQQQITLLSREELEKRKRGFLIEIGELEVQQKRVVDEIAVAKKKDLPALNEEKRAIESQLELLRNQLEHIDTRIDNFNETEPVDRMATVGLDQEITFSEERKLAASDEFKNYREEGVKALEIENELRKFQEDLDRERAELVELLSEKTDDNDAEIELKTAEIQRLETTIQELNAAFNEQMRVADRLLPEDEIEAMKMKNLLVRGVQPIKTAVVATALIQMPSTGFAIDENAKSIYSEENPIPVDVKNPSGLTYRVQIGAFSRPIPQDLFSEFNPVSGEKIGTTGITRYMAGFFNNSEKVIEARESIKSLGYNDAFVVAYCDGERITFGEARRLEAAGLCVPKGTNELILEVAENTADHLGIPTTNELVELPEYSYNQAPGAAKADPIELKQGLFFTVQIGVYNRPVDDAQLKNLSEILTVRLPNGLIRYATGMFDSAEEAAPRRTDAINRGIADAFIVAYYKGERVTVAKARMLLEENGPSILQSTIEKTQPLEVVKIPENAQRTDSVSTEVVETTITIKRDARKVQIVTKKTFDEYPRDVLNRYNTEGNFYYDENDRKVKSEIYSSQFDLPRLYKFEKDIDTVYLSEEDVQNEVDKKHILVKISDDKVPGDLADWLLRMGYQKKFERTKEGLELHIEGIEPNRLQDVQYRIREVGLEPILVEPTYEEIEDN